MCALGDSPPGPVPTVRPADGAAALPVAVPAALPVALTVPLVRLDLDLPPPGYSRDGDAGADLRTRVDVELAPGERVVVPTGVALALPWGFAGFVHPRSGLAARHGLSIVNAPGTVDAGYRGEILVVLLNTDRHVPVRLCRGDRIAQLVVQRVETVRWAETDALPGSDRGIGGHGSTGGFGGPAGGPDHGEEAARRVRTQEEG